MPVPAVLPSNFGFTSGIQVYFWTQRSKQGRSSAFLCTLTSLPYERQVVFIRSCHIQFIVGYQNLEQRTVGLTLSAPTFLNVASETGCTLADLSVSGYEKQAWNDDDEDYAGGVTGGSFILRLLDSSGRSEAAYYWIEQEAEKGIKAGWYADASASPIAGGAESVTIEKGRALWISANGLPLVTAGSVSEIDTAYRTRSVGLSAIGNNMPVNLTLNQLFVSGYEPQAWNDDDEDYAGGVSGGSFVLRFLDNSGRSEAVYYWIEQEAEKGISAGWYADTEGKPITGGATSVSVPAGKGMWVSGNGLYLNIPAPAL